MIGSSSIETTMGRPPRPVVGSFPADTRDRIALIDALTAPHRSRFELGDDPYDATLIRIEVTLDADDDALHTELLRLACDVRCISSPDDRPLLLIRFLRDGRRDPFDHRVGPHDPWPDTGRIAVDFHDSAPCSPREFERLLARAERATNTVYFINTPPHLRLHGEVCGSPCDLPIHRTQAGPELPEALTGLRR